MNRLLLMMFFLAVFAMPSGAWAYTKSPYPDPYRQTTWNNITDSIHTWGQSPAQAKKTKEKLHTQRTQKRLHDISHAEMAKFRHQRQAWMKSQNSGYQQ